MMVWYKFVGVLIRLFVLISLDGWVDGKWTDTTKHNHATDY